MREEERASWRVRRENTKGLARTAQKNARLSGSMQSFVACLFQACCCGSAGVVAAPASAMLTLLIHVFMHYREKRPHPAAMHLNRQHRRSAAFWQSASPAHSPNATVYAHNPLAPLLQRRNDGEPHLPQAYPQPPGHNLQVGNCSGHAGRIGASSELLSTASSCTGANGEAKGSKACEGQMCRVCVGSKTRIAGCPWCNSQGAPIRDECGAAPCTKTLTSLLHCLMPWFTGGANTEN